MNESNAEITEINAKPPRGKAVVESENVAKKPQQKMVKSPDKITSPEEAEKIMEKNIEKLREMGYSH